MKKQNQQNTGAAIGVLLNAVSLMGEAIVGNLSRQEERLRLRRHENRRHSQGLALEFALVPSLLLLLLLLLPQLWEVTLLSHEEGGRSERVSQ